MYRAPEEGQTALRGQIYGVNRKALSFCPFVESFKEISLKSDFIQFFHDLIHVYSPGAGAIQPPEDKVLMSTEASCHFDAQGLCTCIQSWKNVHKIRGQNYFLKPATSDQSDKTFLFA